MAKKVNILILKDFTGDTLPSSFDTFKVNKVVKASIINDSIIEYSGKQFGCYDDCYIKLKNSFSLFIPVYCDMSDDDGMRVAKVTDKQLKLIKDLI